MRVPIMLKNRKEEMVAGELLGEGFSLNVGGSGERKNRGGCHGEKL